MSNKLLYALWAVLFIICAALGFIPEPEGALRIVSAAVSLVFFLPPAVIVYRAEKTDVKLVFWLSGLSLTATLVLLIGNVLSVAASETVGTALYYGLIIVSSPMVCSGYWAASLFLWASLGIAARKRIRTGSREDH